MKNLILSLLLLLMVQFSFAGTGMPHIVNRDSSETPDVIILTSGDELSVRITKVQDNIIYYRKLDSATIEKQISTAQIFKIRYANGQQVVVDLAKSTQQNIESDKKRALKDAETYYTKGAGVFIPTMLLTGLFGILLGLIPAISFSSSKARNDNMPNKETQSPAYREAYEGEVQKIRRRNAWGGYLLGAVIAIILVVALL